jgi:hypothetical protein
LANFNPQINKTVAHNGESRNQESTYWQLGKRTKFLPKAISTNLPGKQVSYNYRPNTPTALVYKAKYPELKDPPNNYQLKNGQVPK